MEIITTTLDGFEMVLDGSDELKQRPIINNTDQDLFQLSTNLDSITNSITVKDLTISLTENLKEQGIRNEQFSDSEPFLSNSLLGERFGLLGNSPNPHKFFSADVRCECPSCAGSSLPANAATKKNSSGDTAPQEATTAMSGDSQINGILSGYKWGFSWGSRQLTYSFYENDVFAGKYYGTETGVKEVSEAVKTNVRSILNWLEKVVNVDFVEVTETSTNYGRVRIMDSDTPSYAYAYYPTTDTLASRAGDVLLKTSYDRLGDTNGFQHPAGKHGYATLIHEIGHAMGLKHPHQTSTLNSTLLSTAENKQTNTVMTYNFDSIEPGTYMRYDIKALQYLYGTQDYNAEDTTYQFTKIDQFSVNGQQPLTTIYSTKQLMWDSAGTDTLDFSGLAYNSSGYRFGLGSGGLLSLNSGYNATANTITSGTEIAYGVNIENFINSSSNDTVYLNTEANVISGYTTTKATGKDIIYNGSAQDTLKLDYNSTSVTQTQSVNDLILNLGTNGSITLKNYYADVTNQINILYQDSLFATGANSSSLESQSSSFI